MGSPGIYRAAVHDINDPENRGRVRLLVPAALGNAPSAWAEPSLPTPEIPVWTVGDKVYVFFEGEDINRPVYLAKMSVTTEVIEPGAVTHEGLSGVSPTRSPFPTLIGGVNVLYVSVPEVTETFGVKHQIHLSTSPDINATFNDPLTFVKEFDGVMTTIDRMPGVGGAALNSPSLVGSNFYVQIITYNDGGVAPASDVSQGSLRQIDTPDVNVNALWAGKVGADHLLAGDVDVAMNLMAGGAVIARGAAGQEVSLSGSEGILVKGATALQNPTYIHFPTDGRPNIIGSTLNATTLSVEGNATTGQAATFRRNSAFEPGATLTLNNSVAPPIGQPVVESVVDEVFNSFNLSGQITAVTWNPTDSKYYIVTWSGSTLNITNRIYTYAPATDTMTLVVSNIRYSTQNNMILAGFTWMNGFFYGAYQAGNGLTYIAKIDPTFWLTVASFQVTDSLGKFSMMSLGNDGTDLWLSHVDNANERLYLSRYAGSATNAVRQEFIQTNYYLSSSVIGDSRTTSLLVGNFDFGSRRFIVGTQEPYQVGEQYGTVYQVRAFDSTGTRQSADEWTLRRTSTRVYLNWRGTSNNDTAGHFVQTTEASEDTVWTTYSKIKLPATTQTWYFSYTYFRASDSKETTSSQQATLVMRSRWKWKVTVAPPPATLQARIYGGTTLGIITGRLQGTALPVGQSSITGDVGLSTSTAQPPTSSTFGAGNPAIIVSQEMITVTQTATVVSGSPTITNTRGFSPALVGRAVTGTGIPANTTVLSQPTPTTLTLSANATVTSTPTLSFVVPKLEIRGDGLARISELERVILTSTDDANTLAGNKPALRIGNIAGDHLRIDGNEILAMNSDTTKGALGLQGRTIYAWNWGVETITTGAGGNAQIPHNLGATPSVAIAIPYAIGTSFRVLSVVDWDLDDFRVNVKNVSGNDVTETLKVAWIAIASNGS